MVSRAEAGTIAVMGLGAMGTCLGGRLLDQGYDVVVWNRTPEKMTQLVESGATAAENPAAAATGSDAVITMVSDAEALLEVTRGSDGVIAGLHPPAILIQMGTVGPEPVKRLASRLPAGTALLDAPVLGTTTEAATGSLQIFLGGERKVAQRWAPLLATFGSPTYVGPVGAGQAAKLVANLSLFGVLGALGEALALARGFDLTLDTAFKVLATTPLAAQAARRRPSIEGGQYPPRFSLSLAWKDARLIASAAGPSDLRIASAMETWFAEASKVGRGREDYSCVLDHIIRTMNVRQSDTRLGNPPEAEDGSRTPSVP